MTTTIKSKNTLFLWQTLIHTVMVVMLVDSAKIGPTPTKPNTFIFDKPECSDGQLKIADKNIIKLIGVGKDGRSFPTNKNEVKQYCKETDDLINSSLQFFDTCLPEEPRRLGKIYLYSGKKGIKSICTKKKTKKQQIFVNSAPCINSFVRKDVCLETFVNKTKELVPYNIGNDKIKYACCLFVDLVKCAEELLSISCMTDAGREVFLDLIRGIGGDISNVVCGDYNESTDRCENLPPLDKSKFDKSNKINRKTYSFAFAQLEILESIGGLSDIDVKTKN